MRTDNNISINTVLVRVKIPKTHVGPYGVEKNTWKVNQLDIVDTGN